VSEIGKPQARSYFAAAQAFRDGTDTPRAFLERCIATIEALDPQVGAFVATNLPAARTAADAATARWRSRTVDQHLKARNSGLAEERRRLLPA